VLVPCSRRLFFVVVVLLVFDLTALGQEAPGSMESGPVQQLRTPQQDAKPGVEQPVAHEAVAAVATYDEAIFQKPIAADQLAFLKGFAGATSGNAMRDKQFRNVLKSVLPDCMFHYGRDMLLTEAMETVLKDSSAPVRIRDGRYMTVSGHSGPYLLGRGFVWIDLQKGIGLGGFYFHPTNGEPTPTVTVFSRQVKEDALAESELPPAFAADLREWAGSSSVPLLTTRYFIGGSNKRILLEHDLDFCSPTDGSVAPNDCDEANADAADMDLDTAYYLEQIHYATNGTAWMIRGNEQVAWIGVRDRTCGVGPNPLGCRVRMTREHIHVITRRVPRPHR
jgi:uncharacterized protein YecT (DUF1311 family)